MVHLLLIRSLKLRSGSGVHANGDAPVPATYTARMSRDGVLGVRGPTRARGATLAVASNLPVGPIGMVSNIWSYQLDLGERLDALISRAANEGARVIELRQGSLGSFEDDKGAPDVPGLAALAAGNRATRLIPAFEVPFLDDEIGSHHPSFVAGRELAIAVAGKEAPHLRLVDLETKAAAASTSGFGLAQLAIVMAEVGGLLSVENGRQGWHPLWAAFLAARDRLGDRAMALRLCVDPCNLSWLAGEDQDPARLIEMLSPTDVGMIHCKQQISGSLQPTVGPGTLNWQRVLRVVGAHHPVAPFLFEVASSARVWEYLYESLDYLQALGITRN